MASEMTASDCRARAGGEIDAVLATTREEAAEEHGDDVFWVVPRAMDREIFTFNL